LNNVQFRIRFAHVTIARDRDDASVNRAPPVAENARSYPSLLAIGTPASG
jgi:hypothetical protein